MANVHARRIKGNLAFWDTHRKRLIDAVGPDVVKYSNDFTNLPIDDTTSDPTEWTLTVVEVGAGTSNFNLTDGSGGIGRITTAGNDNDGANAQLIGESFELTSDQVLYFGAFGVTISDAAQSDVFIGLAITDTDILGGVTDRIGFQSVDADAGLDFAIEKDSTETLTEDVGTLADATAMDMEFYWDGAAVEVFVDGASVATPAVTNMPDNEALRLSWQFLNGAAGAETCDIDRLTVIQIGR